jgi:hypothetical protein
MPQYLVCLVIMRCANKLIVGDSVAGLTLAVCCILVTCSQARRISQRHDVVGPVGALLSHTRCLFSFALWASSAEIHQMTQKCMFVTFNFAALCVRAAFLAGADQSCTNLKIRER